VKEYYGFPKEKGVLTSEKVVNGRTFEVVEARRSRGRKHTLRHPGFGGGGGLQEKGVSRLFVDQKSRAMG